MINKILKLRTALILGFSVATILFMIFMFFYIRNQFFVTRTEINEDVMIEKITNMGKLELVKYSMKDVIEKKVTRTLLPDKRILFVATGEVVGCIDLTKVAKEDIVSANDSVTVFLPNPEICYTKLDHQRSKVYELSGVWSPSDRQEMIEGIYKLAEQRLLQNAKEMNVLGKTKENALTIFKPILENISGKKVGIRFR
ncbi:DUF4230 domain-containing protein [Paradesertivirga mongoliensis]|uniref:DUF4230 domain-containing protein n=1 Tax=Paradesertivirga mongoliensis TaxID=2100740 RepID=A0ABW4ZNV4_9SPHI|nr:DUF4230 domain-containing protein [Pedobacter mongoliensis]